MVVDDNRDAADSFATLLSICGAEPTVAYDGESALEIAPHVRPQLVFLDLTLPGIDGLEVAARLRSDPALNGVVLVALTGRSQPHDLEATASAGFDHHMTKPVDTRRLAELLSRLEPREGTPGQPA